MCSICWKSGYTFDSSMENTSDTDHSENVIKRIIICACFQLQAIFKAAATSFRPVSVVVFPILKRILEAWNLSKLYLSITIQGIFDYSKKVLSQRLSYQTFAFLIFPKIAEILAHLTKWSLPNSVVF